MRHSSPAARNCLAVALSAAVTVLLAMTGAGADAATGSDPFTAGAVYRGDFPDPSLLRVDETYYAFATTTGGNHVPSMHSQDLLTWTARDPYPLDSGIGTWRGFNDALPHAASYAVWHWRNGKQVTGAWAPSVAAVDGRYVMAYVVQVRNSPVRRCISLATSDQPLGPYVDTTRRPVVCSKNPRDVYALSATRS